MKNKLVEIMRLVEAYRKRIQLDEIVWHKDEKGETGKGSLFPHVYYNLPGNGKVRGGYITQSEENDLATKLITKEVKKLFYYRTLKDLSGRRYGFRVWRKKNEK